MKISILTAILLLGLNCWANEPEVISLLEKEAIMTHRLLPFRVYDAQGARLAIKSVDGQGVCQAMTDPNQIGTVLAYCEKPGDLSLKITLQSGSAILVGPIAVREVSAKSADNGGMSLGETIFRNDCRSCHVNRPIPTGQTEQSLMTAFRRAPMDERGFTQKFQADPEALNALIDYLNGDE